MAYIKCITKKYLEIEAVNGTTQYSSAGFTISSKQGKAPKRVQFWRSDDLTTHPVWLSWNSDLSGVFVGMCDTTAVARQVGSTGNTYYPTVYSVGSTSVTLRFPTDSTYRSGTWTYCVEFE